jgi:predicted PurR-regulated permease PerM
VKGDYHHSPEAVITSELVDGEAMLTSVEASGTKVRSPYGWLLVVLAVVATVSALKIAQAFFIPLVLGVLIAYMLNPLISWLELRRVHRVLGSSLVMVALVCGVSGLTYVLSGEVASIVEKLPEVSNKISAGMARINKSGEPSTIQKVQVAAQALEKATNQAAGGPAGAGRQAPATAAPAAAPMIDWRHFIWQGSMGLMGFFTQMATVTFLVYFLLISGKTFKRKLVRLAGPTLANRKITISILDEMNVSIQRYMAMLLASNVLLALLSWAAFRALGVEDAGAWGVVSGLLHVVPYLGPAFSAGAVAIAAFMQFNTFSMALAAAAASLGIAVVVGAIFTTWATGKIAKMNTAAVFIGLLFWAWLWGIWGMLLAIPIIVIINVIAQHVKDLRPLADLLEA